METLKSLLGGYVAVKIRQIRADLRELRQETINAYRWYVDK